MENEIEDGYDFVKVYGKDADSTKKKVIENNEIAKKYGFDFEYEVIALDFLSVIYRKINVFENVDVMFFADYMNQGIIEPFVKVESYLGKTVEDSMRILKYTLKIRDRIETLYGFERFHEEGEGDRDRNVERMMHSLISKADDMNLFGGFEKLLRAITLQD